MTTTKLQLIQAKFDEGIELSKSDISFLVSRCHILTSAVSNHYDQCIKEYGEVILNMDRRLYACLDESFDPNAQAKTVKRKKG